MKKIYKFENATVYVLIPDADIQKRLRTHTESFIRKVIEERTKQHGNCNTTRNI